MDKLEARARELFNDATGQELAKTVRIPRRSADANRGPGAKRATSEKRAPTGRKRTAG